MKTNSQFYSPMSSKNFFNSIEDILEPFDWIVTRNCNVLNVASVFDIEASSFYNEENQKQCTMYAWVFGINGKCIRGRTWDEWFKVLQRVCEYYELSIINKMIIYVHNLAYEFQWFRKMFDWCKVFATDTRKPLYALADIGIEFRCSYLLSGYSLEKLGENLTKYKVNKKVGDLDYELVRHSQTPLTDTEWGYILNDGLVVMAFIQEEIERLGDITRLPLTKTGYVRNACRTVCLKGEERYEYSHLMRLLKIDIDDYKQLKRTYTGGFTHANVNYVGKVVEKVHSFDFSSSYPAVMLSEKFPMSKPIPVKIESSKQFITLLKTYCCMFDIEFENIRATSEFENYISFSRCSKIEHYILNNGRVVEASLLKISFTEQDFFIVSKMYTWDSMKISHFKKFYKGYLPKSFIEMILKLYFDKTTLKNVEGKEAEYQVSKGMINSCYGMCVTDPCRDINEYLSLQDEWYEEKLENYQIEDYLKKYNDSFSRFLYYPWGVWITAYARRNLFTGILEFKNDYIYSDTDSIKVLNIDKHKDYIEKYNNLITEKIHKCLSYYNIDVKKASPKTIKGIEKPLGVWDYEGMYDRFKTLGAKRYMIEKNGEINITIAGVAKSNGANYLRSRFKTNDKIFKAFENELEFPPVYNDNGVKKQGSGKLCHTYIDDEMQGEVIDYLGNKGKYLELSGVHMEPTGYVLGLDNEFIKLIMGVKSSYINKR